MPLALKGGCNVTVYGCHGNCITEPLFMFADSTNWKAGIQFLTQVYETLSRREKRKRPYLILDNHGS
jgi:hypothetical protein